MTSFSTLFRQLFKQKNKTTYLVILIQLAATLISIIVSAVGNAINDPKHANVFQISSGFSTVKINPIAGWIISFLGIFTAFCLLANFAYLIMTSIKNEKINRSQTWRLVPMSDGKIYLVNTLSSFCSFVYLIILQNLINIIGLLIAYGISPKLRTLIAKAINLQQVVGEVNEIDFSSLLAILCLMIIVGLIWYIVISFLHFTTRAATDFLPSMSNKFVLFITRFVILIITVLILNQAFTWFSDIFFNHSLFNDSFTTSIWYTNLALTIFSLILVVINYYLIGHFVEAKQNN